MPDYKTIREQREQRYAREEIIQNKNYNNIITKAKKQTGFILPKPKPAVSMRQVRKAEIAKTAKKGLLLD